MARWILNGTAAVALLASAGTGWALTAAEAWEAWRAASEQAGQTLTAGSETGGFGTLTLRPMRFSVALDELAIAGAIDQVVLTENPDGTVTIGMSEAYSMTLSADPEPGDSVEGSIAVTMPDLEIVARGEPGAVAFSYDASRVTLALQDLRVEGEPAPVEISVALNALSGSYSPGDAPGTVKSSLTAGSTDISVAAQNPETKGQFSMQVSVADIVSATSANGPTLFFDAVDLPEMLSNGYALASTGTFGATALEMDFAEGPQTFSMTGGLTGGHSDLGLTGDTLDLGVTLDGLTLAARGSDMPFPQVSAAMGEYTTQLSLPLTQAESAAPFALRLVLGDIAVGEELWSLIDPSGALPRDPATAIFDLSGMARLLVNLFDQEAVAQTDEPAQIESLMLNQILLRLAGGEFTAKGGFTFDNADRTTFDGMPAPDGKVDLTLSGGNALLDTLVKLGLLPEESAMMGRMMAGMLARPGPGQDTLVSEITVRPDGTILANGSPLPF